MKILILLVLLLLLVAVVVAAVVVVGRGKYQRYAGMERQRAAGKETRESASSRLKAADRRLGRAQRWLVDQSRLDDAQALEQIRRRLVTVADRHRHAEYGYAGVGAARPVQEGQLAELGSRDLDLMEDADRIEGIVRDVTAAIERNEASELEHLRAAVDDYASTLERRRQSL